MAYIVIKRRLCSSRKGATVYRYGIAHSYKNNTLDFKDAIKFNEYSLDDDIFVPVKFSNIYDAKLAVMQQEAKDVLSINLREFKEVEKRGKLYIDKINMNNMIKDSPYISPITTYHIFDESYISEIISMQKMSDAYIKIVERVVEKNAK